MAKPLTLWLQQSNEMRKLGKPSKTRIVKQKNGDWYIVWYCDENRYRAKLGLNKIKNLELREKWAQRIVNYIDEKLYKGECISEQDIPTAIIPPAHQVAPNFEESVATVRLFGHWRNYIVMKELEGCSKNWVKKLRLALQSIEQYAAELGKLDFGFEELGRDWILKFKAWRFAEPRGHGINHVAKDLSILRSVLKDADIECDLPVNKKYQSKVFRVQTVQTDEIALTMQEIEAIAELDLSAKKGHELVRDNFLIGCFTALRYSDWEIEQGQIKEVEGRTMLSIMTTKTKKKVLIPLHPIVEKLLKKYNNNVPSVENQTSNRYIKQIAEWAGLDKEVSLKKSKAGKVIVETMPRYKAVKTHTARRTFVTIALFNYKIPPQYVMQITGHKTEKQLLEYARVEGEVAALEIARVWELRK